MTNHYLNQWWLDYWRIYASLGRNESLPSQRLWNLTKTYNCLILQAVSWVSEWVIKFYGLSRTADSEAVSWEIIFVVPLAKIHLTLNVRGPIYLCLTTGRSVSWLLMPWLLTSPGHQQPWYWLCRLCKSWSYWRKDFNSLRPSDAYMRRWNDHHCFR